MQFSLSIYFRLLGIIQQKGIVTYFSRLCQYEYYHIHNNIWNTFDPGTFKQPEVSKMYRDFRSLVLQEVI
jgi:uncharacterized membrane protein